MELLYLWIKHYKNLENFEIQLNPKYKVIFNKDNFSIKLSLNNSFNIFGNNINIIALAGKNGCGKSNIINLLKLILDRTIENNYKYLLIYRLNGILYFLSSKSLTDIILSNNPHLRTQKQPLKNILFSQFCRQEDFLHENAHTRSTVKNYAQMYKNGYFCYDRFEEKEVFYSLAKMLNGIKENEQEYLLLTDNPHLDFKYFTISENYDTKQRQREKLKYINNRKSNLFTPLLEEIDREMREKDLLKYCFLVQITYLLKKIINNLNYYINHNYIKKFREMPTCYSGAASFLKYLDEIRDVVCNWNKEVNGKVNMDEFLDLSTFYIDNFYSGFDEILSKINLFSKQLPKDINTYVSANILDYIGIRIDNVNVREFFKTIFSVNFIKGIDSHSKKTFSFMELSSGEQRILRFIADLITIYTVKDINHNNLPKVIFLDEIDLSWHPEWQRKFILYLLDTLNNLLTPRRSITVIISTHSPFILSDIPRENIILIDRKKDSKQCCINEETVKTFGTNIHTLLAKDFFMDSTIGAFAEKTIKDVVKNIRCNKNPDYCDKVIELMDDGIYKTLIKNMQLYQFNKIEDSCNEKN